jgi:hypothetical protein
MVWADLALHERLPMGAALHLVSLRFSIWRKTNTNLVARDTFRDSVVESWLILPSPIRRGDFALCPQQVEHR